MLPLGLFRIRNFVAANAATLALYGVFNGAFFLLIIYLQAALGYSALTAGTASVPVSLTMVALASRLGRLTSPLGPRRPMTLGLTLVAVGIGLLAWLDPGDSYWTGVLPGVLIFAFGLALTVPPLTNAAVSSVPGPRSGLASAVNTAVARTAGLVFVAVLGLIFAVVSRSQLPAPQASDNPAVIIDARDRPTAALESGIVDRAQPQLQTVLTDATVDAYRAAMLAAVLVALLGALLAWRTIEDPGDRCGLREWLTRLGQSRRRDSPASSDRGHRAQRRDGRQSTLRDGSVEAATDGDGDAKPAVGKSADGGDAAGALDGAPPELRIRVRGMRCSGCERAVETAVADVPGVREAKANYRTGDVWILTDTSGVDAEMIRQSIDRAGYRIRVED
jgi:copper chaperone CopZ